MEMQHATEANESQSLQTIDVDTIKNELDLTGKITVDETTVDHTITERADSVTEQLFSTSPKDVAATDNKSAIEHLGLNVQVESAKLNTMLNAPIGKLAKRSEDGGDVGNALVDLKLHIEDMDPAQIDFEPGWFTRLVGHLPFIGTPIKRYFTKFEKTSTVIEAITNSLKKGKSQLERDNITLIDDQKRMREVTHQLEKTIQLAQLIDQKLSTRIERELTADDPRFKFLQDEILFPLRQRIMDLQQQLVVNQQGVIAIEIIIRNNKELIRGVNRTLNVTMSALKVGATLAIALADQKIVLDKINAVNETTNKLIAGTAERLKTQGAAIQKQASSTQLDMQVLKQAFNDIKAALDDISTFRQNALPTMAASILELNDMSKNQEEVIKGLEKGNDMSSPFDFGEN